MAKNQGIELLRLRIVVGEVFGDLLWRTTAYSGMQSCKRCFVSL